MFGKSSNSETQDHYSFDPDNKYSKGWKFEYETQGSKGVRQTQVGRVVEVCPRGARSVKWDDDTSAELLHIEDIEECKPVPTFKRTLRVGDEIEYQYNNCGVTALAGEPITVEGTVTKIEESNFNGTDCPHVSTSENLCPPNIEGRFKLKKSKHPDAPRTDKWHRFKKVNLEFGSTDYMETEEEKNSRLTKRARRMIHDEGFGNLGRQGFAAVEVANYVHSELKDARADDQVESNCSTGIGTEQLSENEGIQTRSKSKNKQ